MLCLPRTVAALGEVTITYRSIQSVRGLFINMGLTKGRCSPSNMSHTLSRGRPPLASYDMQNVMSGIEARVAPWMLVQGRDAEAAGKKRTDPVRFSRVTMAVLVVVIVVIAGVYLIVPIPDVILSASRQVDGPNHAASNLALRLLVDPLARQICGLVLLPSAETLITWARARARARGRTRGSHALVRIPRVVIVLRWRPISVLPNPSSWVTSTTLGAITLCSTATATRAGSRVAAAPK